MKEVGRASKYKNPRKLKLMAEVGRAKKSSGKIRRFPSRVGQLICITRIAN